MYIAPVHAIISTLAYNPTTLSQTATHSALIYDIDTTTNRVIKIKIHRHGGATFLKNRSKHLSSRVDLDQRQPRRGVSNALSARFRRLFQTELIFPPTSKLNYLFIVIASSCIRERTRTAEQKTAIQRAETIRFAGHIVDHENQHKFSLPQICQSSNTTTMGNYGRTFGQFNRKISRVSTHVN